MQIMSCLLKNPKSSHENDSRDELRNEQAIMVPSGGCVATVQQTPLLACFILFLKVGPAYVNSLLVCSALLIFIFIASNL